MQPMDSPLSADNLAGPVSGTVARTSEGRSYPAPSAVAELLKPVTWFPPMWAFSLRRHRLGRAAGRPLGPGAGGRAAQPGRMVCATSQAVNDWFDRHVDAINEPQRPIPSGRMPGRWGLYVALIWTLLSLAVSTAARPLGLRRRGRRPAAGLGLQRAAACA